MYTVGEIAKRVGRPVHRVLYYIRSRRIQPVGRAGRYRLFDDNAVRLIVEGLR